MEFLMVFLTVWATAILAFLIGKNYGRRQAIGEIEQRVLRYDHDGVRGQDAQ